MFLNYIATILKTKIIIPKYIEPQWSDETFILNLKLLKLQIEFTMNGISAKQLNNQLCNFKRRSQKIYSSRALSSNYTNNKLFVVILQTFKHLQIHVFIQFENERSSCITSTMQRQNQIGMCLSYCKCDQI